MIDVLCWCPSREMFAAGMSTTYLPGGKPIATLDKDGNLVPADGVVIDEIGPIYKSPGTVIEGFHVNLRAYGSIEQMLTAGLPQTDKDGNSLGLFERTRILQMIPGLSWKPIVAPGVPAGYQGPNGVLLFDPDVVKSRSRVWL